MPNVLLARQIVVVSRGAWNTFCMKLVRFLASFTRGTPFKRIDGRARKRASSRITESLGGISADGRIRTGASAFAVCTVRLIPDRIARLTVAGDFGLAAGSGGVSAIDLGGLDARAAAVIDSGHPSIFSLRADCTDFAFRAGC